MITSFEVGAVFEIDSQPALESLTALSEKMQGLLSTTAELKSEFSSLGRTNPFGRATRGADNLQEAIFKTTGAYRGMGEGATAAGATAERAAAGAATAVDGIGTAIDRVDAKFQALRANMERAITMPALSGGGYGGDTLDGEVISPLGGPRRAIGYDAGTIEGEFEEYQARRLLGGYGGSGGGLVPSGSGYSGGGSGPYYSGRTNLAASGGGGVGSPPGGGGIPLNPGGYGPGPSSSGAPHFGIGEMVETATLYHGFKDAMETDDAITRAEAGLNLPTERSSPIEQAARKRLATLMDQASVGTIYDRKTTAMALPTFAPELGFTGSEGLDKIEQLFPVALRFAEVGEREGLGNVHGNLTAGMQYGHLTGRYQPDQMEKGLDTFSKIALSNRETYTSVEAALSYSLPVAQAAGMDADQAAVMTGFLQSKSRNSTTAGTGMAAMLLGIMDTGGPQSAQHHARVRNAEHGLERSLRDTLNLSPEAAHAETQARRGERRSTAHTQALASLGITDQSGHLMAKDGHGNIDMDAVRHDILEYAQHHNREEILGVLHNAFGLRGERQAEQFTTVDGNQAYERYRDTTNARPGVRALQDAFANTPLSLFEQSLARSSDLLNTLATTTLPALNTAFRGITTGLTAADSHLKEHPDEAVGADLGIVSLIGSQLANAGRWLAGRAAAAGVPGAARVAGGLGSIADLGPQGLIIGAGIVGGGLIDDAVGYGVDSFFGKGAYAHYREAESKLLHGIIPGIGEAHAAASLGEHSGRLPTGAAAIANYNRLHPGAVAITSPLAPAASGVAAPPVVTNSNNTTTATITNNITVNAPAGADAHSMGATIMGYINSGLRGFLTHSSGAGEGITSAAATVGAHP